MKITMLVPGLPFNGGTLAEGKSLGGSETAGLYLARALASRGHDVTVFAQIPAKMQGRFDGVDYLGVGPAMEGAPLGAVFHEYAGQNHTDVMLIQRIPDAFRHRFRSDVNLLWVHDLALKRNAGYFAASSVALDAVLPVSEFHRKQVCEVWGVPPEFAHVLPNGVDLSAFDGYVSASQKFASKTLLYSSRPERGLEHLVGPGGLMELLQERDPEIRLLVCGYDHTTPEMKDFYQSLWKRCDQLPNVRNLGPLSQDQLHRVMQGAFAHVYPGPFEETSCITAMEEQAAGTPFIGTTMGALPETLAGGGAILLEPMGDGRPVDLPQMADAITALAGDFARYESLHLAALSKAEEYTHERAAIVIEELHARTMAERRSNPHRTARHLLKHSDIRALEKLGERHPEVKESHVWAEYEKCYGFFRDGTFARHYAGLYENDALVKGVVHGPEDSTLDYRFRSVRDMLATVPAGSRILDYACAHGHFTINLAKARPDLTFVGVDFVERNIQAAKAWAAQDKVPNVTFHMAGIGMDDSLIGQGYDVVMACEVLEHVASPGGMVDALAERVAPGGSMLLTTPWGPWEWAIYWTEFPWRQHVWNMEASDLRDMFGHHPGFALVALPQLPSSDGTAKGHHITRFQKPTEPSREINWNRKLATQVPQETLSVCMICKPDSRTLGKTLQSVRAFANEIIIGMDCGRDGLRPHKGPAWDTARDFLAETFPIKSPLEIGFAEARNQTIARAQSDWILWIDDDESMTWPENMGQYLRRNMYDAYAIAQHHYSVEPPERIKTDWPCRLFRNGRGIKFHGLVHEHPEQPNEPGAGRTFMIPPQSLAIAHPGYDTENTRRARFQRNWPLMVREFQSNGKRLLTRMLFVRDLAHMNRFEMEKNGRAVTEEVLKRAHMAYQIWRELADSAEKEGGDYLRMTFDSLEYVTECVNLLTGGGGIEAEVGIGVNAMGIGDHLNGNRAPAVRAKFLTADDVQLVTRAMVNDKLKQIEGKYI